MKPENIDKQELSTTENIILVKSIEAEELKNYLVIEIEYWAVG